MSINNLFQEIVDQKNREEEMKRIKKQQSEAEENKLKYEQLCKLVDRSLSEEVKAFLTYCPDEYLIKLELDEGLGVIEFKVFNLDCELKLVIEGYTVKTHKTSLLDDKLSDYLIGIYKVAKEQKLKTEEMEKKEAEYSNHLESIKNWWQKICFESFLFYREIKQQYDQQKAERWQWTEGKSIAIYQWTWTTAPLVEDGEFYQKDLVNWSLSDELDEEGYFTTIFGENIKIPHQFYYIHRHTCSSVDELKALCSRFVEFDYGKPFNAIGFEEIYALQLRFPDASFVTQFQKNVADQWGLVVDKDYHFCFLKAPLPLPKKTGSAKLPSFKWEI